MIVTQQFSGSLQAFSVGEALQLVASAQKSGVMRFSFASPELSLLLAFQEGRVVAVSGKLVPRLSEVLLRQGVAPAVVGQLGLELSQTKALAALQSLALQTLGRATLEAALWQRTLMGLLPIWTQSQGAFDFGPAGALPVTLEPGLKLDALSLEVVRRLDELAWDVPEVPAPDAVYAVAERIGDFTGRIASLEGQHWQLLHHLDGERSLGAVGREAVLPWDDLVRAVGQLEAAGLIEPRAAQRGIARRYPRLKPGDLAPAFTLPALDGSNFSLGQLRGGRTLLAFHRHAGCPFCNLRIHELIEAGARLEAAGVRVVAVFGSDLESLRERVGQQRPPFTLLADPDDAIHTLYGTGRSLLGLLDPRAAPKWLEGRRLGITHGSTDGQATRMPADFLIGPDLRIEAVRYGSHGADHLGVELLEHWGKLGALALH